MSDTISFPHLRAETRHRKRKRRWPRVLLWTALVLLVFLLIGAGAFVFWLRSITRAALPTLDGNIQLTGLSAPVTVQRDAHGVPHISAATQKDLFVAQGYITAQDRLWQMDAFRRNSEGELAEVMGRSLLRHDETQRVLGIRRAAERIYVNLAPQDRAPIDAYARGVNLFIAQNADSLPPEFRLLRYTPRPWTGVDTIAVGLMMVQTLDTHAAAKLGRSHVAAKLHNAKLEADLYPIGSWRDRPPTGIEVDLSEPHPAPPPATDEDDEDEPTETQLAPFADAPGDMKGLLSILGLPTCEGCAAGSNNWVIAGEHTASGKPLLSNDMHLGFSVPGVWYMADLRAPGFHVAGVTLPGFPMVIAGHNDHVAWGFTALMADVQDLYVEKLDGKGNYLAVDGTWKPLTADRETIHVRGGSDVTINVESTDHGPIVDPILTMHDTRTIALKW
ncbi:MAG TPA: penicillin acylase family protein, partial [Terracidiphilus sp.]|nr:penicillin acylase family protein [Terracidiphilus sp.]